MRRVLIGVTVSLLFLYFALRDQDYSSLWQALRNANYWWLVPAIACYCAAVVVRSWRWAALLRPVQRTSWQELFPVVAIGYMANNVLPLRAGELVRAYALGQRLGVSRTATLATIVVERVLDGLTMIIFVMGASIVVVLGTTLWHLVLLASAIFSSLLGLALVAAWSQKVQILLRRIAGLLPQGLRGRSQRMLTSGLTGLSVLRDARAMGLASGLSLLSWLAEAAMYALIAEAFGFTLRPAIVLLTTAVANLATLIPSSPGYVGPFEAGILLVLSGLAGLSRSAALSYALVLHAALYFPITLLGLLFWWRQQWSWTIPRRASFEEAS